jgi:hypothetical protein
MKLPLHFVNLALQLTRYDLFVLISTVGAFALH